MFIFGEKKESRFFLLRRLNPGRRTAVLRLVLIGPFLAGGQLSLASWPGKATEQGESLEIIHAPECISRPSGRLAWRAGVQG